MSRYSSSGGYTSYSSYRSPYSDSTTSSFPTYESKFDALITRSDGSRRSRAGTSTKYDYLSSYSSKYDYPTSTVPTYSGLSRDTGYNSSAYKSPYTSSSTYKSGPSYSTSKTLNADDLTRSYFEKYYNKNTASDILDGNDNKSSMSRGSRAISVYLDEASSPYNPDSIRTSRATSVLDEIGDNTRKNRYSRLLSISNDEEPTSSYLTNRRSSLAPTPRTQQSFLDRDDSNDYTKSHSRYSESSREEESKPREFTSRFLNRDKEEVNGSSPTPATTRRSSIFGNDSSSNSYRRDYTRTYGGRTEAAEPLDSYSSHSHQNGYSKDEVDSPSSTSNSDSTGGLGGLKNLGNTCFMNSVIQCLSNTRELMDFLTTDQYSHDINSTNSSMKGSLVKAFATTVKNLWKANARIVDPSSLKGAIQRFAPRFSGYNQEDSQELLRYLLEGLHEDVNRVTTKPQPINTEIDSNLSVHEQAMEAWKRYLRRDDSKLVDIFVGQLKSTLRCSTCDYESVTFEPFWDLSLPIPSRSGEISLNDCLEAFTKEEVLDGDEMPTCARCKARRKCIKYYSLYKLPRVLVIHLKRFSPTERFRSKLSTTVNFPLTGFDVAKYSDTRGRTTYSCYAVSNHSGTLYSGHYTAYAKNPRTSEWHYFNDSRVSKSSSSNVISNEAYLLFFELL